MRLLRLALLAAAVPLFAPFTSAQSPAVAKSPAVRDALQKFVDDGEIVGAVALVGRKDGTAIVETVGYRDLEAKTPMTADTVFRIASMTKPVTALAVMILADEGKLNVADPVEKYLPEFKGQKLAVKVDGKSELKDAARPITLRDLLTHTSGLPGAYPGPMKDVYKNRNFTLAETVAAVAKEPLQFEPGSKWAYCNAGMDTLGRVVEVVSGKPYDVFLKTRIFDPLGMADTTPYPSPELLKRAATVYDKKDGKLVANASPPLDQQANAKHPVPAGGLFSTAADMARLYRMTLNKGELDGKRIISEKTLAEMTRTQTGNIKTGFVDGMSFGYGFAVVKEPQGVTAGLSAGAFGHGGLYGTQSWADPNKELIHVLLFQRAGLQNGDGSPVRKAFHDAAAGAVGK
jgi:CubicO group peptidase (beta-lactamase class C family)